MVAFSLREFQSSTQNILSGLLQTSLHPLKLLFKKIKLINLKKCRKFIENRWKIHDDVVRYPWIYGIFLKRATLSYTYFVWLKNVRKTGEISRQRGVPAWAFTNRKDCWIIREDLTTTVARHLQHNVLALSPPYFGQTAWPTVRFVGFYISFLSTYVTKSSNPQRLSLSIAIGALNLLNSINM